MARWSTPTSTTSTPGWTTGATGDRGARIGPAGIGRPSGIGSRPLPRSPDARRAVQGQCRSPPPHPEAAAPGHRLGRVRRRPTAAREPDGVVHGRGGRGLAGRAAHDPGRAALVLIAGDPDRPDAAGGVPPRLAPDRGADRPRPPPARARPGRARPHHPVPPGRDAGGAATPTARRGAAPAR